MLSYHALTVFAALCLRSGIAQLSVAFPLNSQLPPVAIANQAFRFAFSPDTFSLQSHDTEYELATAPNWLQLDGQTRTLSGTPSVKDVGHFQFGIRASGGSETVTEAATLVVIDHNTISGNQTMLVQQLRYLGSFSVPSTVLLHSSTYFDLSLGNTIFQGIDNDTQYYAVSVDNTPLPAWISFDPIRISFSGTTPPLLTPQASPETYTFTIAASQVVGFAQSALTFSIAVTNHVLAFAQPLQQVNASAGDLVHVPSLIDFLRRDTQPIVRSTIVSVSSNQPIWLTLNLQDISFSGSSPKDLQNTLFRVSVVDDQNNLASMDIQLQLSGPLHNSPIVIDLGTATATAGQYFSYVLADLVNGRNDEQYDVDFGSAGSWLNFVQSNLTLQDLVPVGTRRGPMNISISTHDNNDTVQVNQLTIMIIGAYSSSTPTESQPDGGTMSPTSTPAGATPSGQTSFRNTDSRKKALALTIALPVLTALVICFIFYLFKRSSKKRKQLPIRLDTPQPENGSSLPEVVATPAQSPTHSRIKQMTQRTSPILRIDLPWTNTARSRVRQVMDVDEEAVESPQTRSSWDEIMLDLGDSHISSDSSKPAAIAIVDDSSGIPAQASRFTGRRSSGLGHGSGLRSPVLPPNRTTLREVPTSSMAERGRFTSGAHGFRWSISPTRRLDFSLHRNLYPGSTGKTKAEGRCKASSSSSGSRYDENERVSRNSTSSTDRGGRISFSVATNDGEHDWTTIGSIEDSRFWGLRHGENERLQASDKQVNKENRATQWLAQPSRGQAMVTTASRSFKSQISEQSQSNSLRFL